jgi:hypothetical protein
MAKLAITIETLASSQIRRDLYTVAEAGVRSGQRPAADARIKDKLVRLRALYLRRARRVSQLTPVEVPTGWAAKPPEKDIARCLYQPLTGKQDDVASSAHGVDLHNLPSHIREMAPIEQVTLVVLQSSSVALQNLMDLFLEPSHTTGSTAVSNSSSTVTTCSARPSFQSETLPAFELEAEQRSDDRAPVS